MVSLITRLSQERLVRHIPEWVIYILPYHTTETAHTVEFYRRLLCDDHHYIHIFDNLKMRYLVLVLVQPVHVHGTIVPRRPRNCPKHDPATSTRCRQIQFNAQQFLCVVHHTRPSIPAIRRTLRANCVH